MRANCSAHVKILWYKLPDFKNVFEILVKILLSTRKRPRMKFNELLQKCFPATDKTMSDQVDKTISEQQITCQGGRVV